MALENFDLIVERAKLSGKKNRVVIAGADAENILLGTFEAQEAGFATPVLVGEADKIVPMLERLGLKDQTYELVETQPEENVVQKAIDLVEQGQGDILMRGNTQTREFLIPLLDKKNVYFVPFRQDEPAKKPTSLVADFTKIPETIEAARKGEQIQPLLLG